MANKLYEKMKLEIDDHLPIHTAMLQNLEPDSHRYLPGFLSGAPSRDHLIRVISIADKIIDRVNQTALLAFLGTRDDSLSDESSKVRR